MGIRELGRRLFLRSAGGGVPSGADVDPYLVGLAKRVRRLEREVFEMSPAEIKQTKITRLFELLDEEVTLDDALDQTGISYEEYQELMEKREQYGEEAIKVVAEEEIEEEEIELKHATHEQVKYLTQIIRQHPDYGVSRLTSLLNSEEYGSQEIKESVVKRELVRMKLETKEKREAFSKRELPTWASYR